MLLNAFHGFCMALADSVPGVSGGTIAFIMGFYDDFIGSIDRIVFGNMSAKKSGLSYLIKLGIGWVIGMGLAVVILTSMFESHIYTVSSLFIGFIAGAIPLIIMEEKDSYRPVGKGIIFAILGAALVVGISLLNNHLGQSGMDLSNFSAGMGIRLFFTGMLAISAMFLPGISGSTILLIFGAYMPVMTALRGLIGLDMSYLPGVCIFALGVAAGAVTVVRIIKICLDRFRCQTVYAILGMMIGSFYAIVLGPTTLDNPQPALGTGSFNIIACIIGLILVLGMQKAKTLKK